VQQRLPAGGRDNPDARIVQYGAQASLGRSDVAYLANLSADAVPAMDQLAEPLRSCLLRTADATGPRGLRDWNLGRARAAAVAARPASFAVAPTACAPFFSGGLED